MAITLFSKTIPCTISIPNFDLEVGTDNKEIAQIIKLVNKVPENEKIQYMYNITQTLNTLNTKSINNKLDDNGLNDLINCALYYVAFNLRNNNVPIIYK
jgi:hypothetical protein